MFVSTIYVGQCYWLRGESVLEENKSILWIFKGVQHLELGVLRNQYVYLVLAKGFVE